MVAGDRVAVAWPTSVDFVIAYLGVLAAGAVCAPLNPNSPAAELVDELEAIEPVVVLVGGAAAALAGVLGSPTRRVIVPRSSSVSDLSWEQLSASVAGDGGDALAVTGRENGDLAVLLFTSGTAGSPKAAMLTHGNLTANLRQMLALPGEMFRSDDIGLAAFPLFHIFGLNVALGPRHRHGSSPRPPRAIRSRRIACASCAPTGSPRCSACRPCSRPGPTSPTTRAGAPPLSGVRRAIAGAAALSAEVSARFERRYALPVWQGYGLTEASPAVATSLGTDQHRPGSVGRPLPGVEIRLVDDSGEDVLAGDPGEIWVKGPNVFSWLLARPRRHGAGGGRWLVAHRRHRCRWGRGRPVRGGPQEGRHQRVGIQRVPSRGGTRHRLAGRGSRIRRPRPPDPVTEESVEAVVVTVPGVELRAEDVRAHCQEFLAHYKCPSTVRFVTELPRGLDRQGAEAGIARPAGRNRLSTLSKRLPHRPLGADGGALGTIRLVSGGIVRRIPEATVARLPVYQRILLELVRAGTTTVSSDRLAELGAGQRVQGPKGPFLPGFLRHARLGL